MACPKIVQDKIGWQTKVRIGLGLFRRSEILALRFTPLIQTHTPVCDNDSRPVIKAGDCYGNPEQRRVALNKSG